MSNVKDKTKSEPVIVTMSVLAALQFFFAGSAGISILTENSTVAGIMAMGSLGVAAAQVGMQFYVRGQVIPADQAVPAENVVEKVEDGVVVAGPANDRLNEGAYVRPLGDSDNNLQF